MNPFQAYIDVMAVIGQLCVCFLIGFAIIWAISGTFPERQITQPLPPEPFQSTSVLEEVH